MYQLNMLNVCLFFAMFPAYMASMTWNGVLGAERQKQGRLEARGMWDQELDA